MDPTAENAALREYKECIEWLETRQGCALVSDDHSHWAIVTAGMQNVPDDPPQDIQTTFFIKQREWRKTIMEAYRAAKAEDARE